MKIDQSKEWYQRSAEIEGEAEVGCGSPPPLKGTEFFDGIQRKPVDKTSAMMFAKGVQYTNSVKVTCAHWESPPPLRAIPPDAPKLVGEKIGRFTVIGLHRDYNGSWVVRCSCGDYELRKAKSILNPNNFGDRCTKCRNVAFERRDYEFHKTGREIDQRTL